METTTSSAAGEAEPHWKGSGLASIATHITRRHGQDAIRALIAELPRETRRLLNPDAEDLGILAFRWYRHDAIRPLLDAWIELTGADDDPAVLRGVAHDMMDEVLKGIYSTLFRLLVSPRLYRSQVNRIWRAFFDNGGVFFETDEDRNHYATLDEWDSFHPVGCHMATYGTEYIYAAMGCKDVKVTREKCRLRGDGTCGLRVTWR